MFILAIDIILLIGKYPYNFADFCGLLLNYSFVTIPLSLMWLYFENIGWRSKYWKWLRNIFNFPPNFRGRWEGYLDRIEENNPHKIVIEIKQSMTKICIKTYSKSGCSESITESICADKMGNDFVLCFFWEGKSKSLHGTKGYGKYNGYSILKLIDTKEEKKLIGDYFTNRSKQTMGKIETTWIGSELLKKY